MAKKTVIKSEKTDLFTVRRALKFVKDFRASSGQLPTLQDLDQAHFNKEQVDQLLKENILEEFYVTLQTGTIMKGYKIKQERT